MEIEQEMIKRRINTTGPHETDQEESKTASLILMNWLLERH